VEQDLAIFWNIKGPVDDAPTIQFTVQEVDPGDELTPSGQSNQSPVIAGIETGSVALRAVDSPTVLVSWELGGSGSFSGVYLTAVGKSVSSKSVEQLDQVVDKLDSIDQKTP